MVLFRARTLAVMLIYALHHKIDLFEIVYINMHVAAASPIARQYADASNKGGFWKHESFKLHLVPGV